MHFWPIVIRLVLAANVLGTIRDAHEAWRGGQRFALQWLVPKAAGWSVLLWAVLPTPWGGVGKTYWEAVVIGALAAILLGLMIEATDASRPTLPWIEIELPHLGVISPLQMAVLPVFLMADVVWDAVRHGHMGERDIVALVASMMCLVFGVRYAMRHAAVSRLRDLLDLIRPRRQAKSPRPEGAKWYVNGDE